MRLECPRAKVQNRPLKVPPRKERERFLKRLCRRLLTTRDRVGSDRFPLTQDLISQMLGVRRATASLIASAIRRAGLIEYSRGKVTALERPVPDEASGDRHGIAKEEPDRLPGSASRRRGP